MVEITTTWVEEINLSLETALVTSKGGSDEVNNVLFGFRTSGDEYGIGEAAPSLFTGETTETIKSTLREIGEAIVGEDPSDYRRIIGELRDRYFSQTAAVTAVEVALFDYISKSWSVSLSDLFGGGSGVVRTDITLPIAGVEENKELVGKYLEQGFGAFKVKVGEDMNNDFERINGVYEEIIDFGIEPRIKVDANQAFTPKQATKFLEKLEARGIEIELFEQPVPKKDLAGLKEVREKTKVPVAADESLFTPKDAYDLAKNQVVDVFNIKLMESGIIGACDIISIANASSIELMMGCMTESSVSINAAASIVQGKSEFEYIDLDAPKFLQNNLKRVRDGPRIDLETQNGHGVTKQMVDNY